MAWFKLPKGTKESALGEGVLRHIDNGDDGVLVEMHDNFVEAFKASNPKAKPAESPDLAPESQRASPDVSAEDLNAAEAEKNPDGLNP